MGAASTTGDVKFDLQKWAAAGSLLALGIYGAARFGDAAFYARLGTNPDAVGLDYSVTLSRVATTIAVSGASLLALVYRSRISARIEEPPGSQRRARLAISAVTLVLTLALSALLFLLFVPPTLVSSVHVRGSIALVCVSLVWLVGYLYEKADWRASSLHQHQFIVAAALGVVVLFGASALTGYHAAGYVIRGQPLPCPCAKLFGHNLTLPWSSGSSGFLGLQAEVAAVTWIGPGQSPLPAQATLLGTADGSAVLYDSATRRTMIVPAADVLLSPQSNLIGWNE